MATTGEPQAQTKNAANGIDGSEPNTTTIRRKGLSSLVVALRPWSFTASLIPVALGSCLAFKSLGTFSIWIFITSGFTALSVHAAGNLVNTFYDFKKGVDNKKSDDRTLVDDILSPNDLVRMSGVLYCIGCFGFVLTVMLSAARMEHLALIFFGGLSGSFLYTGGLGLKYIGLGDILILLTFGPVTVLFAYISQGGPLCWSPILYTIPLVLNTEAILHSNNTRDMESDREAGIVTAAILIGKTGSYVLFTILLFLPYIVFTAMTVNVNPWFCLPLLTIFTAFKLEKHFRANDLDLIPINTAKLNFCMGIAYIIACALADKSQLPGLLYVKR